VDNEPVIVYQKNIAWRSITDYVKRFISPIEIYKKFIVSINGNAPAIDSLNVGDIGSNPLR